MTTLRTSAQPQTHLNLALFAFALLGLEIVLLLVEPVLPVMPGSVEAAIAHWVLTIIFWVSGSIALVTWARRRVDFSLRGGPRPQAAPARWSAIVALVAATLVAQWALHAGTIPWSPSTPHYRIASGARAHWPGSCR